LKAWRQSLMAESFYQDCHSSYAAAFKATVGTALEEVTN